jgi:GAF domain-containing protein
MKQWLQYFTAIQYPYSDSSTVFRGRLLIFIDNALILSSLALSVLALLSPRINNTAALLGLAFMVVAVLATWLLQQGNITGATGVLLVVLLAGTTYVPAATGVHTPVGVLSLIAAALALSLLLGEIGAVIGFVYSVVTLGVMALLQSEGLLFPDVEVQSTDEMSATLLMSLAFITFFSIAFGLTSGSQYRSLKQLQHNLDLLDASNAIGQVAIGSSDVRQLLQEAVNLILQKLDFYQVQVFLLDEANNYAQLVASTGEVGQQLLASSHRLAIGSRSVVGQATLLNKIVIVNNTLQAPLHHFNVLLPDTRSELAIPISTGDTCIGALDVQSKLVEAFQEDDIEILKTIVVQLSNSIQNVRRFQSLQERLSENQQLAGKTQARLEELEQLGRQMSEQAWHGYFEQHTLRNIRIQRQGGQEIAWNPRMEMAAQQKQIVISEQDDKRYLTVPLNIRGHSLGVIEVELEEAASLEEITEIVQTVSDQLALTLDNARLLDETRMIALQQVQLNLVTSRLQGVTDVEQLLQTALAELSQTLGAQQGYIRLLDTSTVSETIIDGNGAPLASDE